MPLRSPPVAASKSSRGDVLTMFVLDDNVYTDVVLQVVCDRHLEHSVRVVLERADPQTARTFLEIAQRLTLRCTDVHQHLLARMQSSSLTPNSDS